MSSWTLREGGWFFKKFYSVDTILIGKKYLYGNILFPCLGRRIDHTCLFWVSILTYVENPNFVSICPKKGSSFAKAIPWYRREATWHEVLKRAPVWVFEKRIHAIVKNGDLDVRFSWSVICIFLCPKKGSSFAKAIPWYRREATWHEVLKRTPVWVFEKRIHAII